VDVLAHGLWGGLLFGRKGQRQRWAFLLGAAPDVIAFGPLFISELGGTKWTELPRYVYQTYNATHSLVVWTAITGIVCLFRKQVPWVFCPWGLHILCDIPWHEISFFPTPSLWPFKTPLVNGVHWAQLWLLIPNYVALTIAYARWRGRRGPFISPISCPQEEAPTGSEGP
jgi:hypothetical protein